MSDAGYLLGFDVGSSSVKASLVDIESGSIVGSATSPDTELKIIAREPGWAEQHPDTWWQHMGFAVAKLREEGLDTDLVRAAGISYQMHGLVVIDSNGSLLRPSIIWCDGRAVPFGDEAFEALGPDLCLSRLLNSPGNFTATKLAWVKQNEPEIFDKVWKMMVPGDYLTFRMTGEVTTTPSGLSEAILWDAQTEGIAGFLLDHLGFDPDLIPRIEPTFSVHGRVLPQAAGELGIPAGIPVSYRAGDQPNNALSLNVFEPGELAATAGTSGVVYGVADRGVYDPASRVNTFVHVNHTADRKRYGVLLCLNGTGICNRWFKQETVDGPTGEVSYDEINSLAAQAPVGSEGLVVLPYGNGAERTLENKDIGASVHGLNFNVHSRTHLLRAAQEGIVFGLADGFEIMKNIGMDVKTVRAGATNMFQSELFRTAFATTTGAVVELYDTDGSAGAARGAGIGAGIYSGPSEAFGVMEPTLVVEPDEAARAAYTEAFANWSRVQRAALDAY